MSNKFFQILALAFILLVLSKNVIYFPSFLRSMVTGHPLILAENPPGRDFLPFKPYLQNIPVAGYYSDSYNETFWNSAIASRTYQQAQHALAPTLLDVEHCFDHPYIIFACTHANCESQFVPSLGLKPLIKIHDTLILTRITRRTP